MADVISSKDLEDALRIVSIFSNLSEESKSMVVVYSSALRDKEIIDNDKARQQERR